MISAKYNIQPTAIGTGLLSFLSTIDAMMINISPGKGHNKQKVAPRSYSSERIPDSTPECKLLKHPTLNTNVSAEMILHTRSGTLCFVIILVLPC